MTLERILTITLFLAAFIAGGMFVKQTNLRYNLIKDENHNKPYVKMEDVFKEPLTIWWPGISGIYPKYIEKADMKGLGWEEFPVYSIKKSLTEKYGVTIVDWIVSPSRLEREFQLNRRPVCIYPHKWKNPEIEFKEQKHLLSYALDLSGEDKSGIIIRQKDLIKFIPYLNKKGDLDIISLLKNSNLKTALIKGENYSEEIRNIYKISKDGNLKLDDGYSSKVHIMVASDNSQLIKMLIGNRIDYIFDHLVTSDHYKIANINPSEFDNIIYRQNRIGSLSDPNIIYHSIRCNLHPINKKILPTLNKLSGFSNDWHFKGNINSHRAKFDRNFAYNRGSSLQNRFLTTIHKKDWWFKEFSQDKILEEGLVRKPVAYPKLNLIPKSKNGSLGRTIFYKVYFKNDQLVIIDPGFNSGIFKATQLVHTDKKGISLHSRLIKNHLTNEVIKLLKSTLAKDMTLDDILKFDRTKIKHLTIIAPSITPYNIEKIFKKVSNLKGLHVLFGHYNIGKKVYHYLPDQIEELSLIGLNLNEIPVHKKIRSNQLKYLDLSFSLMMPKDLKNILENQAQNMMKLKLERMQGIFNIETSAVFKKMQWKSLNELNLENTKIGKIRLENLVNAMTNQLGILNLKGSYIQRKQLNSILNRCTQLKTLKLSNIILGKHVKLPRSIEELEIKLEGENSSVQKILVSPGMKIKKLDITSSFTEPDLVYLNKILGHNLNKLSLHGDVNPMSLSKFLNSLDAPNLFEIDFSNLGITNEHLKIIANRFHKIQVLNMENNLITDSASSYFSAFIFLKSLILNRNFLTTAGIINILKLNNIKNNLVSLHLDQVLDVNPIKIANYFPKRLEDLSIHNGWFNDEESLALFNGVPNSLTELAIQSYFIKNDSIAKLKSIFPPKLEVIEDVWIENNSNESFQDFINFLPNSLYHLSLGGYSPQSDYTNHTSYPPGLLNLTLNYGWGQDVKNWESIFKRNLLNIFHDLPGGLNFVKLHFSEEFARFLRPTLGMRARFRIYEEGFNAKKFTGLYGNSNIMQGAPLGRIFDVLNQNISSLWAALSREQEKGKFFPKYFSDSRLNHLILSGPALNDELAVKLSKFNLSNIDFLSLSNSNLTERGISSILKGISKDAIEIRLISSKLDRKDIDTIIKLLPASLQKLNISGSTFGLKGYIKFREWKKLQEEKYGHDIRLIEY